MIIKHVSEAVAPQTDTDKLSDVEAMILEKTEELRQLCFNAKRQCIIVVDSKGREDGGGMHFWNMRMKDMDDVSDQQRLEQSSQQTQKAAANLFSMLNQFAMTFSNGQLALAPVEQVKSMVNTVMTQGVENLKYKTALETLADYDEQPIWADSRDDAADGMLTVAREALGRKD
jgi:hypothetical protein